MQRDVWGGWYSSRSTTLFYVSFSYKQFYVRYIARITLLWESGNTNRRRWCTSGTVHDSLTNNHHHHHHHHRYSLTNHLHHQRVERNPHHLLWTQLYKGCRLVLVGRLCTKPSTCYLVLHPPKRRGPSVTGYSTVTMRVCSVVCTLRNASKWRNVFVNAWATPPTSRKGLFFKSIAQGRATSNIIENLRGSERVVNKYVFYRAFS